MALPFLPLASLGDPVAGFAMDVWSRAVGQGLEGHRRGRVGFGVRPIVMMMMPLLFFFVVVIVRNRSVLKVGSRQYLRYST